MSENEYRAKYSLMMQLSNCLKNLRDSNGDTQAIVDLQEKITGLQAELHNHRNLSR